MTPVRDRRLTLLLILAVGSLASAALSAPADGNVHRKGSAPLNSAPPTISGSPVQGQTLSASVGSWTGTTPIHYAYQWRRSSAVISGAAGSTYTLTPADVGHRIDVVVTASNSVGAGAATSAPTSAVSAPPPTPPPAPTVTGLSPNGGPEAGGTPVSITGSGFSGATAVKFGGHVAASFTVNSASSITAVSAAGTGTVDVTVTGPNGTSAATSVDTFSYWPPASGAGGEVRFVKNADSSFDAEDFEANGAWMREHFSRMITYSPFFDSRTSWYPNAWAYQDAYAIYVGSALAKEHPEWIVKDAAGEVLYIPWGNPPTQYAADISNPAFRSFWIQRMKAIVAHGYAGVFVDDVDMWANTSNYNLQKQTPISRVTGQPMSDESWREYLAMFMAELRAALPACEIVHNNVWYAAGGPSQNKYVEAEMKAANVINVERGVNDSGLTGGTGQWSLYNLFHFIDLAHGLGDSVLLDGKATDVSAMEYNLAAYFLISNGKDFVKGGGSTQNVKSFWPGWSVNLGEPTGPRERASSGLWKRSFRGGAVYLLEPGASPQTIALPTAMKSVTLGVVGSITLSPGQAAVLLR
ncbi:MAG: hypothetical protein E6G34_06355 [Actinobacteria bacterium]|nr:MAG: hypothetical protein E6G34_06355 [Actinomycetota bacterium]